MGLTRPSRYTGKSGGTPLRWCERSIRRIFWAPESEGQDQHAPARLDHLSDGLSEHPDLILARGERHIAIGGLADHGLDRSGGEGTVSRLHR
jgi:hypothetical protein